jgi:hypothetical protein
MEDAIIQEVQQARAELFAEVGNDPVRLLERLMREQQEYPERLVSFPSPWTRDGAKGKGTPLEGTSTAEEVT